MSDIVKILPYSVDLNETIKKTELHTIFVMGNSQAHRFEIKITKGGEAVDLAGCTVTANFTNFRENTTIDLTGNVENGKAIVTLSRPCYTLRGQFVLSIQIKSGDVEATVFLGEGHMRTSKAEKIVYEDYVIYDVDAMLAQIATMKTATKEANDAAAAADAAAAHAPYINTGNKHWMTWDTTKGAYVDTGTEATGPQGTAGTNGTNGENGITPHIGANGNWWIGSTDTGTKAQGPAGANGTGSGTVTGVKLNGTQHVPDQTGLVDLGNLNAESVGALDADGTAKDSEKLGGFSLSEIMLKLYPVGAIYTSTVETSPASIFGGTWEQLKDRFLLGAGDSYAAGSTGGEASVILAENNLPARTSVLELAESTENWNAGVWSNTNPADAGESFINYSERSSYGADAPHNNMPPYLTVYMWKRVS